MDRRTHTVACVAYEAHDRTIHFTPEEGRWEAPQTSMSHSKAMSWPTKMITLTISSVPQPIVEPSLGCIWRIVGRALVDFDGRKLSDFVKAIYTWWGMLMSVDKLAGNDRRSSRSCNASYISYRKLFGWSWPSFLSSVEFLFSLMKVSYLTHPAL